MPRFPASISAHLLAFSLAACGGGDPTPADPDDLSARLAPIRDAHDVPSLAGAVVRGDDLVALGATGRRRRDADTAVTAGDRFHIGSCTKAMTATLVAQLVDEGALRWELPVAEALPGVAVDPAFAGVTVAHLLAHRSGIPTEPEGDPGLDLAAPLPAQRRRVAEWLLGAPPAGTPGAFAYSNGGYVIAGAILEATTGRSWEDLMRERLFGPLGMSSCGFGAPGTAGQPGDPADQPWGHRDGVPVPPGPMADNLPVLGPAGTVHCSLADWSRFAAAHLAGARGEGDLVSAESFRRLHAAWPGDGDPYGLGWAHVTLPAGEAIAHDGSNTLWYAIVAIVPSANVAVVTATNDGSQAAAAATIEAATSLADEYAR